MIFRHSSTFDPFDSARVAFARAGIPNLFQPGHSEPALHERLAAFRESIQKEEEQSCKARARLAAYVRGDTDTSAGKKQLELSFPASQGFPRRGSAPLALALSHGGLGEALAGHLG